MTRHRLDELTPREREVLALIARRMTNGDIAKELDISFDTAKSHVSNILAKLGVDAREEAATVWRDAHGIRARVLAIPAMLFHASLLQRALIGVAALAGVGGLAVGIGLGTGTIDVSSPPPTISVPLSELKAGEPVAVQSRYTGQDQFGIPYPVFVARQEDGSIKAFLGRDAMSGCAIHWREAPLSSNNGKPDAYPPGGFKDGCSGAIFLVDGFWYSGPSPRGLDGYTITIDGSAAVVHLDELILGRCSTPEDSAHADVSHCSTPGLPPLMVTEPPAPVIYHWGLRDQIPPPVTPPTPLGPADRETPLGDAHTTAVTITSEGIFFDHTNITVAAKREVTFTYDNEDQDVPHNFVILQGNAAAGKVQAKTAIVIGPVKQTLTVVLPPGTYHFECEVHPNQMNGTITAR